MFVKLFLFFLALLFSQFFHYVNNLETLVLSAINTYRMRPDRMATVGTFSQALGFERVVGSAVSRVRSGMAHADCHALEISIARLISQEKTRRALIPIDTSEVPPPYRRWHFRILHMKLLQNERRWILIIYAN